MDDRAQSRRINKDAREIKRTAEAVERGITAQTDSADQRTVLASDRTLLAAERTYAAWVRTSLAALAAGIGARALVKDILPMWVGKVTGSILVVFACFCLVAAVWRELHGVTRIHDPDIPRMPRWLLVPMNFFLLLVAVTALIGIWAA